jgi:predicted MPP superfamily phosphohydrolase
MDDDAILARLEQRLGRVHVRQRLGIERDHEARMCGGAIDFFHSENWYSIPSLIRNGLRVSGLYWRARGNTRRIRVRHNAVQLARLPRAFDGFTVLHISDMHVDMNPAAMRRLIDLLPGVSYDACVLTGDFRGRTHGPVDAALAGLAEVRAHLDGPVYGVLGNHDSLRMVPMMEDMGIRVLLNEAAAIERAGRHLHVAGIDDAHYYRVDDIGKAASAVPDGACAILLTHTPEVYRQAAHAGFDLLLGGHTHGGQICLPGSIPITLDSVLPRRMGAGPWRYRGMAGYTSVGVGASIVAARLNCPPEITLHHLHCG